MKVFISHKDVDSNEAMLIKKEFEKNGVDAYLDVLDSSINGGGKTLTEHIKKQLNSCTDIIVLMSENTKFSWWVPFEIGMSAQKNMPTASFLEDDVELPSYLSYWPRLKKLSDVATYVSVRKKFAQSLTENFDQFGIVNRLDRVELFYELLKKELR